MIIFAESQCRQTSPLLQIRFSLRQGIGDWVPRAPWKIEWGGGSSVENPHYQRVHYCELLVSSDLCLAVLRLEQQADLLLIHRDCLRKKDLLIVVIGGSGSFNDDHCIRPGLRRLFYLQLLIPV